MSRTRHTLAAAAAAIALAAAATCGTGAAHAQDRPLPTRLSDFSAPASDPRVIVTPIDFPVTDPGEPGSHYKVRGFLYEPAGHHGCRSSILQANHALTTGAWYWDIPYQQQTYSIARHVAASGIPFLALNKLGYGQPEHPYRASDKPDGRTLTVLALADVSHQITQQLREMGYQHVGLIGHSAGSEESEIQAGKYQDVDALILSGFTHLPTADFSAQYATKEVPRAGQEQYPYFFGDPATRDAFLFTDFIDKDLVASLHPLVNHTPAGEILSIGPQPSRAYAPQVKAPVLTLIGKDDRIFSADGAEIDRKAFTSSPDVTFNEYDNVGHGVEFHRNGPQITADVVKWLHQHPNAMPTC